MFGTVTLSRPRFYRWGCHPADSQTFSPLTELFTEHTVPWPELAFRTVASTLRHYFADRARGAFGVHTEAIAPGVPQPHVPAA